jgi:hypothetical protein
VGALFKFSQQGIVTTREVRGRKEPALGSECNFQKETLGQAEAVELVFAFGDDLVRVDPDVALPRQHVNVSP